MSKSRTIICDKLHDCVIDMLETFCSENNFHLTEDNWDYLSEISDGVVEDLADALLSMKEDYEKC